jgi:NAD(P)-dependent dehydrogenase (short-subunit alcohol dehydrogenase family)
LEHSLDLGLRGKVALVTGAANGIGRAVAQVLAEAGCAVTACDIDSDRLASLVPHLPNASQHAARVVDLAQPKACEDLVAETAARCGRLDILCNVAAVLRRVDLEQVDEAVWDLQMDVNVKGPFFLCRAAGEAMKANRWGRIINFTSQGAHTGGFHGSTVYAASKGGVLSLTKSLARIYAPWNICVNAIAPGAVDTAMMHTGMSEADLSDFVNKIPLGRMSTPREQAMGVLFLASGWASHITGHCLDINGGLLMR